MSIRYFTYKLRGDPLLVWGVNSEGMEKCFNPKRGEYERYLNWVNPIDGINSILEIYSDPISTVTVCEITEDEAFLLLI
jgi:hypothetical protein